MRLYTCPRQTVLIDRGDGEAAQRPCFGLDYGSEYVQPHRGDGKGVMTKGTHTPGYGTFFYNLLVSTLCGRGGGGEGYTHRLIIKGSARRSQRFGHWSLLLSFSLAVTGMTGTQAAHLTQLRCNHRLPSKPEWGSPIGSCGCRGSDVSACHRQGVTVKLFEGKSEETFRLGRSLRRLSCVLRF